MIQRLQNKRQTQKVKNLNKEVVNGSFSTFGLLCFVLASQNSGTRASDMRNILYLICYYFLISYTLLLFEKFPIPTLRSMVTIHLKLELAAAQLLWDLRTV